MIDKNIQPDYSIKEEKLRLHAALPLLAPAIATAIGAALGLTGTGLVLQKQIQNYFANNPGALDSIASKFGTKPGDQPEVEEELKELTKPTTTPIKTWEKSFADTGTQIPEKLPEPKGIEVPPQEKVSPPGFQKAEPLGIDILTKDIPKPGIGHNQPPSSIEEKDEYDKITGVKLPTSLKIQNSLDPKLIDELLKLQGGIEGHRKLFEKDESGFSAAPMPASTKKKMYHELFDKMSKKYNVAHYPEGETPETVSEERKEQLMNTYNKRAEAIDYITSAAYDVINGANENTIFVVDEDGLPMAAAKIELNFSGPTTLTKDALTIVEAGSVFKKAGDQLFNNIIQRAKDEDKRFIVAEDLTSTEALEALKKRDYEPPTTKETKRFKGRKIHRPSGRVAYQKNLVLDLGKTLSEKELLFLKDLRIWGVPERASSTLDSKIKKLSEGEKVNLTEKESSDLMEYGFKHFEQRQGSDEAIFDSIDDLELLDKKLRLKKAQGGLIDKPLTGRSRYI